MASLYRKLLTPEEQVAAWRMGAYVKFASMGIPPSGIDTFVKRAGLADSSKLLSPVGMAKAIAAVSVLTGVPLGLLAHVMDKRISQVRTREKDLTAQTDYYRNAAQQLEQGLAGSATQL